MTKEKQLREWLFPEDAEDGSFVRAFYQVRQTDKSDRHDIGSLGFELCDGSEVVRLYDYVYTNELSSLERVRQFVEKVRSALDLLEEGVKEAEAEHQRRNPKE